MSSFQQIEQVPLRQYCNYSTLLTFGVFPGFLMLNFDYSQLQAVKAAQITMPKGKFRERNLKTLATLATGASSIVFALAAPAVAQDAASEDDNAITRVLAPVNVTATKSANVEDVQSVPISVTAFNEDTLDALKVRNLESLNYSVPNVSLDDIGTARGSANFSIRGLGVNSSIPSIDPAVGVFVDGVYLGFNGGVVLDMFDLDSVEVLRGPQGLLFGRNTTGGALLVNTGNPTEEFEAKARVAVEDSLSSDRGGSNYYVQGTVSGPLIQDKLHGKVGVYYNNDEGYFKNLFDGSNHGGAETTILRGALEWFASDNITMLLKGERLDTESDGPSGQNRGIFDRDSFDFSINEPGSGKFESTFITHRTDIEVPFGDGVITNIFGYRDFSQVTTADIDSTPLTLFHSDANTFQEQFSNELRYAGSFEKFDLTTGVYYFESELAYDEVRFLPSVSPSLDFYGGGKQDHTVFGIFGQADFKLTDKLTGIIGVRYSNEEKDAAVTYIRPRLPCFVSEGTCPTTGVNLALASVGAIESNGFNDNESWSNITPRFGFQYVVNDGLQFYGNYTKGVRSGGYNFRITDANIFENLFPAGASRAFDDEKVHSVEIGAKWQSDDGRMQVNTAAFMTEISDMQREVNLPDPSGGVLQNIVNTANAEIKGLEVEGRFAVTDNLLLTGNLGLIDAEYTGILFDISGDGVVSDADLALAIPRVPDMTYGVGLIHDANLGSMGSVVSTLNFQHKDEQAYTDNNFGWINPVDSLNFNVSWNTPVEGISVSLYGNNMLDEVAAGNDTQLPFGGNIAPLVGLPNNANGVNEVFGDQPGVGTFSPLKKGRIVGLELTLQY